MIVPFMIFCCPSPSEKPSLFLILGPNIVHVFKSFQRDIDVNDKKEKEINNTTKLDLCSVL